MKIKTWSILLVVAVLLFVNLYYNHSIYGSVSGMAAPECPEITCPDCPDCVCTSVEPAAEAKPAQTITRYVCPDGTVVDAEDECTKPAASFEEIPTPGSTDLIEKIIVRPTCVKEHAGGLIYYVAKTIPDNVAVQLKQGSTFTDIYEVNGNKFENYIEFGMTPKSWVGSFQLEPGKIYTIKVTFDFTSTYGTEQYSSEYEVDARNPSDYLHLCNRMGIY
ncbi:hypothetical protein GF351_05440 [Candidatus Woesearchaeota archaeon]|nr:hypothetical protein [Candidatus Woesearchaeota archaeon]